MAGDNRRSGFTGVLQGLEDEATMRGRVSPRQPSVGLRLVRGQMSHVNNLVKICKNVKMRNLTPD